ncbi:acyloxyacyl hydrolase [Tenuifilum sp.]|uniref:acyloxyacyl hydrolase n=1 Tax=Tenuifilum sp. TaxID=2760880 RepID=UPI001B7551B8|nr:acyloxyacyl hydrolase [Bacteroidales bacterium]HOK61955.1 acyloxyacyl hydrolase [Tenuifilum sp.]MBP9030027.1 acyloxyacyl hydrolase [Bacteroidales bacterium]HOK86156.1 acyloxyacyl hydrolase [Tenuifilum sp.]HON71688.1 acyloxyacyl hydrolase [Tenuifilum sp.]
MLLKRKLFFTLTLALFVLLHSGKAQEGRYSIDIKERPGFIIPHHSHIAYFLKENVNAIQLNFGITTDGSKFWHKEFNYPIVGLGLYYSGLGNDTLYGKLTGLYTFINRPFLDNTKRFNISNTLSVGLSYASKWHNPISNRSNMVLSTPLNVFFQYEIGCNYRISTNHNVSASIGLTHASNGSVKEPNLGFNIFTTALGYRYSFGNPNPVRSELPDDITPFSSWNFGLFASIKSIDAFSGKQYGIIGLSAEKLYRFAPLSMAGLELTAYKDNSIPDLVMDKSEDAVTLNKNDNLALTINATYLMGFNRIGIVFQPGIYLRNQYYGFGAFSNKVGLRINIYDGLILGVAIKAHWFAQADFVEFGIKNSFNRHEK